MKWLSQCFLELISCKVGLKTLNIIRTLTAGINENRLKVSILSAEDILRKPHYFFHRRNIIKLRVFNFNQFNNQSFHSGTKMKSKF